MRNKIYSIITGTGSYIPTKRVPNKDFLDNEFYNPDGIKFKESNEEIISKFEKITGILERRHITDNLVVSDIAYFAAKNAIESAKIDKEKLDYIIVAQNFGDVKINNKRSDYVPSISARVKHKLDIKNPYTIAFDLPFGCPGWLQGVIMSNSYIKSGNAKKILIILLTYLENNLADKTETKIDDIIFDLLNKFSGIIIYALAVVLSLDILGVNVMPFIAGAGVIGIAIGFAAKDTLSNLIAGVLLIIDRPFEIGDRIEVWSAPAGSATWGDVIDIGLRATKIQTTDNIIIIVPNNEIMMRDIINYTIITSKIRVRINIGIAYDADMLKAKDIILKVVDSIPWVLKEPLPKVVATAFGESSVDLQLRAWIDDARKRMDTISHVTDKVKEAFDKDGIKIPYPRRDITIIHKE